MSIRNALVSTLAVGSLLLLTAPSGAQQSADQQKCLNALNKNGAAVAKVQGQENVGCVKGIGTGKIPGSAQACLTADSKQKVGKAQGKTTAAQTKSCGTPPDFGYTSAGTVNTAAASEKVSLMADIFGAPLDPAVISCASNKAGCTCQQKALKSVEGLAAVKFSEFVKCKKAALKAGANAASALANCVSDAGTAGSIAADSGGKITKAAQKLSDALVKSCVGISPDPFPGDCAGQDPSNGQLSTCLDQQVECRVCLTINSMDGLSVDCDLFDDGTANTSCVPPPPPLIHGALPPTAGKFNYNMTLGLPGANAACNTNFAGTHACSYQELQTAEAAGQLVNLKDTNGATVTSFWVIDNTAPALQQCVDDALGGSNLNWEYGTAHTASRGRKVNLTNPTGTLGVVQTSVQCNLSGSSWVGCCS
jgi:hypothetical protein